MALQTVYVFNPEHDLALASGETNYMAPASARQMAADLAVLPIWYMAEGARVLAPSAYHLDFLAEVGERFRRPMALITAPELCEHPRIAFSPWGWDYALQKRLLSLGVGGHCLPDGSYIRLLRKYAHRSCAAGLLPQLQLNEYFCGESFWLRSEEEWQVFVESRERCLLKAPLSGSGKGLNWCKGVFTPFIKGWCSRVAASQDGVIAEPVYEKKADFAMEFYADGSGGVLFAGYSLFRTNGSGMYASNLLLSDEAILQRLSAFVPRAELIRLQACLTEKLSLLLGGFYRGYLGVDMMICHFPEANPRYRIHPCVEINLRMNMGVVSRIITDRYLSPVVEGIFRIVYSPRPSDIAEEHARMQKNYPLHVEEGRICSGYQPLVPVTPQSRYLAFVCCHPDVLE